MFLAGKKPLVAMFGCVILAVLASGCADGGTILGTAVCDDKIDCTADSMLASGVCNHVLKAGFCQIDTKCWPTDAANPASACEVCNPTADSSIWSPAVEGSECDDKTAMTVDDVCDGQGRCEGKAVQCLLASDCKDVPECANAECTDNACRIVLKPGFCRIDGVCIASDTMKPGTECRTCIPASAVDLWSMQAEGTVCDDKNPNTTHDQCNLAGVCAGTLVACLNDEGCDDQLDCTTDTCNLGAHTCEYVIVADKCLIAGACVDDGMLEGTTGNASCHRCVGVAPNSWTDLRVSEACDDGVATTVFDVCAQGGTCAGTEAGCLNDGPCGDGLDCTTDTCNLTTYSCEHQMVDDACLIDDACVEDGALESVSGNGSCRKCVASAPDAWTIMTDGGPCDDGMATTVFDVCGEDGVCAGEVAECLNDLACDDSLGCTTDTCNLLSFTCVNTLNDGSCLIDGACIEGGALLAATGDSSCRVCVASTPDAWTVLVAGDACDDGQPTTVFDACGTGGDCAGQVAACLDDPDCNDGKTCTTDTCNLTTYTCGSLLKADACWIDGVCYSGGGTPVNNTCVACDAALSQSSWTILDEPRDCGTAGVCSGGICHDPWPPVFPWESGKECLLPVCNESMSLPFDHSGNWTVTTRTTSTTCNELIQTADARFVVGAVHTGNPHPLDFVGGCDYSAGTPEVQIGTFVSNVEITCAVQARPWDTTSVETGVVTFLDDGTATGVATVTLFDIPVLAGQPGNKCVIEMEIQMHRIPDCTSDGQCSDGLDCTTDSCELQAGICRHVLAPDTCVIDGACVADGTTKSATGDGSCLRCVGSAPSQYGWIYLQSGETCNDGNAGTVFDHCGFGGVCAGIVPECLNDAGCDDSLSCTTDTCSPDTFTCSHVRKPATCFVDGVCAIDGAARPGNACQGCVVATSTSAWTTINESGECGTVGVCWQGTCTDPWPPSTPWHDGKTCQLPACDIGKTLPFDSSGYWTVITRTIATDCNELVQTADPRFLVGDVHKGNPHTLNFSGSCDYQAGGTSVQIGTFASNVEVTCEVTARPLDTTSVETSVVTFANNGTATGKTTVDLYDIPEIANQAGNHCTIYMAVLMQRVPECVQNSDCNDGVICTTDSCDVRGVCVHQLDANTCLINGVCVANMALKGATGNDSCYVCVGSAPSQYGWIQMGSGEPCDDGSALTVDDRCRLGGRCVGT
jgi:hypothetical protein